MPGWPWRLFASALALACVGLGLFARPPIQLGAAAPDTASALVLPDTVSIQVLNGSGVAGLARRVQRYFLGSDRMTVWTAPGYADDADRDDYRETVVVSHLRSADAAKAAARLLGLPEDRVVMELDDRPPADVTIILGADAAMGADTLIPFTDQ